MTTPPAKYVVVDGARVAYVEEGEGEPVLLLHGYPETHAAWRHQIPELAKTHRVIAVDWFGWGDSDHAELSYRYEDEVARLGKLLDALALPRCNVVAHDYGGYLAIGFAIAHPNRVMRLGILNSRAHDTFPRVGFWGVWLMCMLARIAPWLVRRLPLATIHRLGLEAYENAGCFDHATVEGYVAWLDSPVGRSWFASFYRGYSVRPRREMLAALSRVEIPMAFVWGSDDGWCPPAIARELAAAVPDAALTIIDHGNHFIMEHRPDEVTAALRTLLARAPAQEGAVAPALPTHRAPIRSSETVRAAILAGWSWSVCAVLVVVGMLGLFFERVGGLPTNQVHAIVLNLGAGLLGFAFARFAQESLFVVLSGLGMILVSLAGFNETTRSWMYETFNLNAASSWFELLSGVVSLLLWLAFRPHPHAHAHR